MSNKRKWIVAAIMTAVVAAATSPFWLPMIADSGNPTVSGTEIMLDTAVTVTVSAPKGEGQKLVDGAMALISELETALSRTKDGDIASLDRDGSAAVGEDADALLAESVALSEKTGGAFDPALGNVIDLWDFKTDSPSLPDPDKLASALKGADASGVRRAGDKLWTLESGAVVDLGAIAKGYIGDRVAEYLADNGAVWAAINLGGNTSMVGYKPDKTTWSVGIRNPDGSENSLLASVEGDIKTAVTSGDYERYFELDGVRYCHILDPETGYPARSGVSSVTVIGLEGSTSAEADAYSTALFVMGAERGKEFIETLPAYEAVFVSETGEITCTSGVSETDTAAKVRLTVYK